tara:strand:- start:1049 stop:1180 length:132 start_codon:yes stop_codon:yes gene_type:complete
MIKKITLTLILCLFLISCGKKGDPEYKESEKKILFKNVFTIII